MYELSPGDNAFILTMKEKSEKLEESKVVAEIPLMTRLRDTTIFNTQAIKSMSGDGLRDVIEQIPGFSVADNEIYYNGEKVTRTYVNGLLIFGDETMRAVNALKADEVTQVKFTMSSQRLTSTAGSRTPARRECLMWSPERRCYR